MKTSTIGTSEGGPGRLRGKPRSQGSFTHRRNTWERAADSQWPLLIVIPARNEEASIASVIGRTRQVVPEAAVLVVNDGSTDGTVCAARAAGARVTSLPINIGYGGALQTGFQYACRHGFGRVVTLDADGQHNPEDIPALLKALQEHSADVVIGSRFVDGRRHDASLVKRATIKFFSVLTSWFARQRITDTTSGFQAIGSRALRQFAEQYPHDYPNAEVLVGLARQGGTIVEVPIASAARIGGASMFNLWSSSYYVVKMTLSVLMVVVRGRRRAA